MVAPQLSSLVVLDGATALLGLFTEDIASLTGECDCERLIGEHDPTRDLALSAEIAGAGVFDLHVDFRQPLYNTWKVLSVCRGNNGCFLRDFSKHSKATSAKKYRSLIKR